MANWPYVKIGDVCTVERGGSPRPIDKFITDDPNGINWIKIGDTNDSMYITSTAQKIISEGMKKSRYVQPGDFLLSNSMSFGRPYILKIDGCIHDGWLVLRDNKNTFDKRFLYYYLSSPSTYRKFENMAVGGVVNNLNSEMVRGVSVPVPPMNEQLEIVGILEQVTALISLRKQQIAKLDELVKARFVEMFGGIHDSTAHPYVPIGSFATVTSGGTPDRGIPEYWENGTIRWVKTTELQNCVITDTEEKITEAGIENSSAKMIPAHSILIAMYGQGKTRGMTGYLKVEASTNQACACILPSEKVLQIYLWQFLILSYDKLRDMAKGGNQPNLNAGIIKAFPILMPPLDLQHQFAAFVAQTDKQKLTIQHSLAKLELLKKALMQKYFG